MKIFGFEIHRHDMDIMFIDDGEHWEGKVYLDCFFQCRCGLRADTMAEAMALQGRAQFMRAMRRADPVKVGTMIHQEIEAGRLPLLARPWWRFWR